jgi:DNA-directed RNA polymerase specialized sigma24 family protein
MVEQEQVARWIIGLAMGEEADELAQQFLEAARLAWPRVLAHTRRELASQYLSPSEITSATCEIWEEVLRSVWGTFRRQPDSARQVRSMESYLIGTFHHRLNRQLKSKRSHDAVLEFLPPAELAELKTIESIDDGYVVRVQHSIQMEKVYARLDENVRRALIARIYGFSWGEIAHHFQIEEQNLVMRVRYAIRKVRESFTKKRGVGGGAS